MTGDEQTTECEYYSYSDGALKTIKDAMQKRDGMIFAPSLNGKSYPDSAIRGLFYSSHFFGKDPILLANTFYWIEQYFYRDIDVTVKVKEQQNREPVEP